MEIGKAFTAATLIGVGAFGALGMGGCSGSPEAGVVPPSDSRNYDPTTGQYDPGVPVVPDTIDPTASEAPLPFETAEPGSYNDLDGGEIATGGQTDGSDSGKGELGSDATAPTPSLTNHCPTPERPIRYKGGPNRFLGSVCMKVEGADGLPHPDQNLIPVYEQPSTEGFPVGKLPDTIKVRLICKTKGENYTDVNGHTSTTWGLVQIPESDKSHINGVPEFTPNVASGYAFDAAKLCTRAQIASAK